uniref:CRAL-TRIO domain-containing protein n=1 Tax=Timema tahoe TaxID=61484 RepID=A0A7R9IES0_9NEOP|nr:unnamed protein product [Timema tahoe]
MVPGPWFWNSSVTSFIIRRELSPSVTSGWEGERRGVASQPTKVSFHSNKNRWITVLDMTERFKIDGKVPILKMGDYTLQLELDDLGEECERIAREELRETPEVVADALRKLKELIGDEKDLNVSLEDYFLIRYLRPCKFYPHSALERIKKFYKFRLKNPHLTDGLSPINEKKVFEQDLITVLPKRTQNFHRIITIEIGIPLEVILSVVQSHQSLVKTDEPPLSSPNPTHPLEPRLFPVTEKWKLRACSLDDIFKASMIVLEGAVLEPRTQICGAEVIFDMEGLSMKQVMQFSPSFAFNLVHFSQECMPLRLKHIHNVNQPYIFNLVFAIFKPFLSEKLRNRIHFHGSDWNSLHSYIDPECLPTKYGGLMDIPENTGPKLHELLCLFNEVYDGRYQWRHVDHCQGKPGLRRQR